jgi:mannitol-1-phosphate/altronate dehydrogenase
MHQRFCKKTLSILSAFVTVPTYQPDAIRNGIVHLGVSAIHRCHPAVYVDDCVNAGCQGLGDVVSP